MYNACYKITKEIDMDIDVILTGKLLDKYQAELKKTYPTVSALKYSNGVLKITADEPLDEQTVKGIIASYVPKPDFDLDALDTWLAGADSIQEYASFFPIISRATEKDTAAGYQLMVAVAKSKMYAVPQNIIDLVLKKLEELGANIGG